jgi:thiamine biosynthesis lipoprotein
MSALRIETRSDGLVAVCFEAMASPCEVLLTEDYRADAVDIARVIATEAWRIERKYSRYREDSVLSSLHRSRGSRVEVDDETAALLNFAQHCFEISDGMFDITSGVLRAAWQFDGSDRLPQPTAIERLLGSIGFQKLQWHPPVLLLPRDMELDFGGFGKEYAVDRAYDGLAGLHGGSFLLNFGGDLRANRAPPAGAWNVAIERPDTDREPSMLLRLEHGALATSGDSHRYLMRDGVRYGHVLDPHSGWPVVAAPRSVTVAASSCTEAGLLSTLALLKGPDAEVFLSESGCRHWVLR